MSPRHEREPLRGKLEKSGRLPSPTGLALEILRLTQEEDSSVAEIAEVLQGDPALTGRILQLANSALVGARNPVTTVHEATVRLGLRSIRQVSLGFALLSSGRTGTCTAFDYEAHWAQCLARGVALQSLCARFRVGVPAEGFVLGLLADIGSLALATVHPRQYGEILCSTADEHRQRGLEQREFGIDRREVTRCLLAQWGLEQFLEVLDDSHRDESRAEGGRLQLPDLLRIASCFACAFRDGESRPAKEEAVHRTLSRDPNWDRAELPRVWQEIRKEWIRWGDLLEIRTVAPPEYGEEAASARIETPPDCVLPLDEEFEGEDGELTGLRVLAVDDDPTSLRLLAHQLTAEGHRVSTARDGVEGLRLALAEHPQIIIADWKMPHADGLQLCHTLRQSEAGRQLYFVLLTGSDDEDHIVNAFEQGVDDFIVKPFRPRILMARVRAGRRVIRLQQQIAADRQAMQEQVSQLGVLNRRLEESSRTDPLTELPNRRAAMEELRRAWDSSERHGTQLCVVMLDVDHFKSFNDRFGHDVGDRILVETAAALARSIRSSDSVYRIGGEEFLAIFPHCEGDGARACAERLRMAVDAIRLEAGQASLRVTASAGLSEKNSGVLSSAELLKAADEALYVAKNSGRNRVVSASMRQPL